MSDDSLSPYEQWMVRSNLTTIRTTDMGAAEIIAQLRANGYSRIAEEVEKLTTFTPDDARELKRLEDEGGDRERIEALRERRERWLDEPADLSSDGMWETLDVLLES